MQIDSYIEVLEMLENKARADSDDLKEWQEPHEDIEWIADLIREMIDRIEEDLE